jgi:hypothetical protein
LDIYKNEYERNEQEQTNNKQNLPPLHFNLLFNLIVYLKNIKALKKCFSNQLFIECGVYWTKFEYISGKIRRILTTNRTRHARGGSKLLRTPRLRGEAIQCASDTLAGSRVQKPKKFPCIFLASPPPTPPPRSGKRNGKEIFGFASP